MKPGLPFLLYLFLVFVPVGKAFCKGDDGLAVSNIPDPLLKDANAVIRRHHREVRIAAANEVYVTDEYAITILNEKGSRYATVLEDYSKLTTVIGISGRLLDKNGNEIDKIKKSMIKDMSPFNDNFFDDVRYKAFTFGNVTYPYTCVYEIERENYGSFTLPKWMPQLNYDCAVEQADVKVIYPKDLELRYRTFHISNKPVAATENEENTLSLEISTIPARTNPGDYAPSENFYYPTLILAADKFQLQDISGSIATWKDFGEFVYRLNANRDTLPDETKKIVHRLTDTCRSANQKIAVLYDYLKKNTRYVSIQLGIGGYQTFDAKFVAEKGYGDCKALSNFMKSLLKEAGITSYTALARSGEHEHKNMMLDFPFNVFDHVILCVPQNNDTVWLECTAKDLPAGYLSSFTDNRYILLLTPDGGYAIKTPHLVNDNSVLVRNARFSINDKNELTGNIDATYTGLWWEKEARKVIDQPVSKVKDHFNREFSIPTYNVTDYKINAVNTTLPKLNEHISLTGTTNNTLKGKFLFITPRILRLSVGTPSSYEKRSEPFELFEGCRVIDTITINVNGLYVLADGPKKVKIEYPFATYRSDIYMEHDSLLKVVTYYDQVEGVYPAELYADYIKLSAEINNNATNEQVVLNKKD